MAAEKKFPTKLAVAIAVLVLLPLLFAGVWRFLAPEDKAPMVAFSEFLAEVHDGKVETIHIQGRDYRYSVRGPDGRYTTKKTVGPEATESLVSTLKPTDPNVWAPKIYLEK